MDTIQADGLAPDFHGSKNRRCGYSRIRKMGSRQWTAWIGSFLLVGIVCAAEPAPEVRLALVGDQACLPLVDLLTAALSAEPGCQLLERTHIERILQEQQLAAAGTAHKYLVLGRLLGAQAIVAINEESVSGRTNVAWRMIATGPGVVVDSGVSPRANLDVDVWLKAVRSRLLQSKDKVVVPAGNAVPISMMRIRYSAAAKDSDINERTFNRLLRQRLMAEPRLFVLERWRLDELIWEKELAQDQQAFWTSGHVLEGQIEPDPMDAGKVTLRLSLTSPQKKGEAPWVCSSSTTDWANAVEQAAQWVAAEIAAGDRGATWSSEAEAALFYAEALAAEQADLFDEARELIEAACGLGRSDVKTQKDRIRIYCRLLDGGEFSQLCGGGLSLVGKRRESVVENSTNLAQRLKLAVRTTELYLTLMEHPPGAANSRSTTELLFFIAPSHVLRDVHYQSDSQLRNDPAVVTLRQLLRAAAQQYETIDRDNPSRRYYYYIKSAYGPLWMETPEEGAALLQQTFEDICRCIPVYDWMFRVHFSNCEGLARWHSGDKDRETAVMRKLAGTLQISTQSFVRIAGRLMEYQWAENEKRQLRMLDQEPEALRGNRGGDIIDAINRSGSQSGLGNLFLASYSTHRPIPLAFMVRLLNHSVKPDVLGVYRYLMPLSRAGGLSAEEKAFLRPAVENYIARVAATARTVKEKDEAYNLAAEFRKVDSLLRPPPTPLEEMQVAAPCKMPDGGLLRGMYWENGHVWLVDGSSTPRLSEMAPEDAKEPPGGWAPPWNGLVPLTDNLDGNADWLAITDYHKGSNTTWILDRKRDSWKSRTLPGESIMLVALVGSNQWSMSAMGELSVTDIRTGTRELKFSHRRKGGVSPLEGCPPYIIKTLKRYDDQHVLIEVEFQLPGYPGVKETEALFFLDVRDNSVQTLLRGHPAYRVGACILGFNPDWGGRPNNNAPPIFAVDPWTGRQTPLLPSRTVSEGVSVPEAIWSVPEDLRLRYFFHNILLYYDGQRLMFFGGTSARLGSRCMLWVFEKGLATGRPIPLTNRAWPVEMREKFDFHRADGTLEAGNNVITVYCPRGILLYPKRPWAAPTEIVYIRMTDIDRYLQAHPAQPPANKPDAGR
jgi:hypothetical protein